jgi:hypothetical protein
VYGYSGTLAPYEQTAREGPCQGVEHGVQRGARAVAQVVHGHALQHGRAHALAAHHQQHARHVVIPLLVMLRTEM